MVNMILDYLHHLGNIFLLDMGQQIKLWDNNAHLDTKPHLDRGYSMCIHEDMLLGASMDLNIMFLLYIFWVQKHQLNMLFHYDTVQDNLLYNKIQLDRFDVVVVQNIRYHLDNQRHWSNTAGTIVLWCMQHIDKLYMYPGRHSTIGGPCIVAL